VSKPAEKRWRGGNRKREEERREGRKKAREDTTMLCCMRRSKQVEKNDEDQKIEEDGINPEDKAHKAATRIQASFRGHTTRKKLQGEKKGDAAEAEGTRRRMKPPWLMAWRRRREKARPPPQGRGQRPGWRCSFEEKKGRAPRCCSGPAAPQAPAPSEEKAGSADTESATKASTDTSPSSKAEDVPAKEEPKQSHVPAAVAAAVTTLLQGTLPPRPQPSL
jgi:hypothetical protein